MRRAWSHAYRLSPGSLCAYESDLNNTCVTLCFHKGHVHADVIWARADAIRVLEHIYAKKSKLHMQDPYRF